MEFYGGIWMAYILDPTNRKLTNLGPSLYTIWLFNIAMENHHAIDR